ncbi:hypothetical protein BDP67DRAFT_576486 [Colletotrichum lupini]|nr:hypothetical protein BDP67DRAFT_576486 [Colletotrichum lupini]
MPDLIKAVSQVVLSLVVIGKPLPAMGQSVPRPGPGEVLICVEVTGLLALDQKFRDFGVFNIASRLPLVLSIDIVGMVVEYGISIAPSDVPFPPIGTRVLFQGNLRRPHAGGLAPYVLADPRLLLPVPVAISSLQAATLITNPFTAALSLFHSSGLEFPFPNTDTTFEYQKAHLIVLGAGTNVGTSIVQLAAIAGIGTPRPPLQNSEPLGQLMSLTGSPLLFGPMFRPSSALLLCMSWRHMRLAIPL